jgi:hypothetical protein
MLDQSLLSPLEVKYRAVPVPAHGSHSWKKPSPPRVSGLARPDLDGPGRASCRAIFSCLGAVRKSPAQWPGLVTGFSGVSAPPLARTREWASMPCQRGNPATHAGKARARAVVLAAGDGGGAEDVRGRSWLGTEMGRGGEHRRREKAPWTRKKSPDQSWAGEIAGPELGSSGRTRHQDCGFVPRCHGPRPQLRGTPGVRQLGTVAREALSRPWAAASEGDFVPPAAPAGQRIAPATQNRTSRRPN